MWQHSYLRLGSSIELLIKTKATSLPERISAPDLSAIDVFRDAGSDSPQMNFIQI